MSQMKLVVSQAVKDLLDEYDMWEDDLFEVYTIDPGIDESVFLAQLKYDLDRIFGR